MALAEDRCGRKGDCYTLSSKRLNMGLQATANSLRS
jgi:hypothetical protein